MDKDIKYIQENFIEFDALCLAGGISKQELEALIESELIPKASYEIDSTISISSPLGDEKVVSQTKKYFPKNISDLIKTNRKVKNVYEFKESLKADFIHTFINMKDNKFGYNNILKENGGVDMQKLDDIFTKEWKSYIKGIYGICTLNATGAEIAKKEIAVKKLIAFNQKYKDKKLSENEKDELIKLNAEFNEVANLFAPYQRTNCSRGKYLDGILAGNALSELIKKYD